MKSIKKTGKNIDIPYYKNWRFYLLVPAVLTSFLIPIVNLASGYGVSTGLITWVIMFGILYYACSQTIRNVKMNRLTSIVSLLIAVFVDAGIVFAIVQILTNKPI